jgi:hypothetical protein
MSTKKSRALQGLSNQIEDLVGDQDLLFQSSCENVLILIAGGNKKAEIEEQSRRDKDHIAALESELEETKDRQLRDSIKDYYFLPKPSRKSILIDRQETRHLNVKVNDVWRLKETFQEEELATLILKMHPKKKGDFGGTLYLMYISIEKLEELKTAIERYLASQKPKIERLQEVRRRRYEQEMMQPGDTCEAPPY